MTLIIYIGLVSGDALSRKAFENFQDSVTYSSRSLWEDKIYGGCVDLLWESIFVCDAEWTWIHLDLRRLGLSLLSYAKYTSGSGLGADWGVIMGDHSWLGVYDMLNA